MSLLTVNVGSSSVRLVAYDDRDQVVADQHVEGHEQTAEVLLRQFLERPAVQPLEAIAHRVVHGGERFVCTSLIDSAVETDIEALNELAPLHNPPALAWIRLARRLLPQIPQVAVFDTAFFAELPLVARSYALPAALVQRYHLRRYGFHGLAHRYLWERWQQQAGAGKEPRQGGGRVISLQLGSGCSVAAVREGVPLDTSMGFSPLEGLVMGTRCGDVDPGLLLYLQRQQRWGADELERCLSHDAGLRGLAGEADMRVLLQAKSAAAELAVEVFCYRARKYIGAYLAVLGAADALLFGGGIGEHLPVVRARTLRGMEWAGIELDADRNEIAQGREGLISTDQSRIQVHVIPVNESLILATEARRVLPRAGGSERPPG